MISLNNIVDPKHYTYKTITGDYTCNIIYKALYINITANNTINLPALNELIDGYYLYLKRVDKTDAITTIYPAIGNTIETRFSMQMSAGESITLIVNQNENRWNILTGNFESIASVRNLATLLPQVPGTAVYNNNPAFGSGEGMYYSDGTAWVYVPTGTTNLVNTSGMIQGDGTLINPITLRDGTIDKQILQWDQTAAVWGRVKGSYNNEIFVDVGGDNSTAQVNNPFRPFLTIDAAIAAGALLTTDSIIYVRTGNYTLTSNLVQQRVGYYFEPQTYVTAAAIAFANPIGTVPKFRCYGYLNLTCTATDCINITTAVDNFYIQLETITSTNNHAIFLQGPVGIEIEANTIAAPNSYALRLNDGSGTITANVITGSGGMESQANGGSWTIYAKNMIATGATNHAIDQQHNHINQYQIDDITSTTASAVRIAAGSVKIITNDIKSTGSYAIENTGASSLVVTFNTLKSDSNHAVLLNGGTSVLNGDIIQGIISTTGSGFANVYVNLIQPSAAVSAITISGNSNLDLSIISNKITSNNIMINITSSGGANIKISTNDLYSAGAATNLVYNNCSAGEFYLKVSEIIAGNAIPFNILAGENYITFDDISADLNGIALFSFGGGISYIDGKKASNRGHCFETVVNTSPVIQWRVMNTTTNNNGVEIYHINNGTGAPDVSIMGGYHKTQKNNTDVMLITKGGGTPIIKLYNPVFVCSGSSGFAINASSATNVKLYQSLITNRLSNNTSFQVGTALVDSNVV